MTGLIAGLIAGLLVFGPAGYATRVVTAPNTARPIPSAAASSAPSAYEQAQATLNAPKFADNPQVAAFARPWLPRVAGCVKSGKQGGPHLAEGEVTRVLCSYGAITVYFVGYANTAERDKARTRTLAQNIDAAQLAPGAAAPTMRRATSASVAGNYVEYAYKPGGDHAGDVVCGLWWDTPNAPVAGYLLAYWHAGLDGSWEPLRDVWQRSS